jgi:hypothetical protein
MNVNQEGSLNGQQVVWATVLLPTSTLAAVGGYRPRWCAERMSVSSDEDRRSRSTWSTGL